METSRVAVRRLPLFFAISPNMRILRVRKYEKDSNPIDIECDCPTCRNFSKSYIRHLFKSKEMLAMRLCVTHNLYFYNTLMEKIRASLEDGTFDEFKEKYVDLLDTRI